MSQALFDATEQTRARDENRHNRIKTVRVQFDTTTDLHRALKLYADRHGLSMRKALESMIKANASKELVFIQEQEEFFNESSD